MPFTEERAERLKALFELIEQNGDCTAHELVDGIKEIYVYARGLLPNAND